MHIFMYILTAPCHATTMSRLPSARGGALACRHRHESNPVGPTLALIFLLLHEQRQTDLDDSGDCPRCSGSQAA
jgi:hypothetical protein